MTMDGLAALDRMVLAVRLVRLRLERAALALEEAEIPHAVLGGNAVFLWMVKHGEGGERFTPNVDILIRRADLAGAAAVLESAGFAGDPESPDLFRDGSNGSPRTRLRLLFTDEKVRDSDLLPNPDCVDAEHIEGYAVIPLAALVQTKLTAYRTVDRVHLRDMLDVGLIDPAWKDRYPLELAKRLQSLIDSPDG